ncbi:hypothetical protein SMALA_4992 [Streptomyces malaysiensis subsp. malaysiensis]|nr:hypothetical protein SMALA_4992 [Streptomyces malaysiensis]
MGRRARRCVMRVGRDGGRSAHHVVQPTLFEAEPEGRGVFVAAVGHDQRSIDAPKPALVDHVQGQLPLLDMTHVRRDAAPLAAGHLRGIGLRRGGIPAPGQEQAPVDRRRGGVRGQMQKWARACRLLSSPSRAAIGSTDLRCPSSGRLRRYTPHHRR